MNKEKEYELVKFEDGEFSLDVNVSPNEDTVWLTQAQMSELFGVDRSRISRHVNNILSENELDFSTCAESAQVQYEGNRKVTRIVKYCNLDMIIAVGYRVNSKRGTLFRKWASSILKQYLLNGYLINEKRCIACQDNIINLNNKVNYLLDTTKITSDTIKKLTNTDTILKDKLFFDGMIYEAYSYIKQLFLSAKSSIIIIDGYVDISVLDMLIDISIPITIYTYPSSNLSNNDIKNLI